MTRVIDQSEVYRSEERLELELQRGIIDCLPSSNHTFCPPSCAAWGIIIGASRSSVTRVCRWPSENTVARFRTWYSNVIIHISSQTYTTFANYTEARYGKYPVPQSTVFFACPFLHYNFNLSLNLLVSGPFMELSLLWSLYREIGSRSPVVWKRRSQVHCFSQCLQLQEDLLLSHSHSSQIYMLSKEAHKYSPLA